MFHDQTDARTESLCANLTDHELRVLTNRVLQCRDPVSLRLLGGAITHHARWCAHGGSASEREQFAQDAPVELLFPRAASASRLSSYDPARPFLPWLRTVLRRLWITHVSRCRRSVVNTELVDGMADRCPSYARRDDLPELSDGERFTPAVAARLLAATNAPRLIAFLAVFELHDHFPEWDSLLSSFERESGRTLPRPFPTRDVDFLHTPRTRVAPIAEQMRFPKPNSLSQCLRRACRDIQKAFPDLDFRTVPQSDPSTTNAEHYR